MATLDEYSPLLSEIPRPASPCVMVIFGGGGDLTKRKLIPALYNLAVSKLLPERIAIVGVDRLDLSHEGYREKLNAEIRGFIKGEFSETIWQELSERIYYTQGDFLSRDSYVDLSEFLTELAVGHQSPDNYLFYLATPPSFFSEITKYLHSVGLTEESDHKWRRIIIEKPFGHDLTSAKELNRALLTYLKESQIYRIDHYLGKETVQNILVYRFANETTEPVWNRRYIDHVQITVSESLGVEQRAGYYERAGALRDMVPNHLLVLLGIIAMEPPNSFDADAVRTEQEKVLRAIQPLSPEDVITQTVRGQYGPGRMLEGEKVIGYRQEPGISPTSMTETFVAMRLMIDNWRWAGVPFYLRTGKRLPRQCTEIAIQYRRAPFVMFRKTSVDHLEPNMLILRIQPNEGIEFSFDAKIPGPTMRLGNVKMNFSYSDYFGNPPSTGYETLIYDCMKGDATLFRRADNVETGWAIVEPIQDVWSALPPRDFPNYPSASWGPSSASDLLRRNGHRWRRLTV